MVEQWKDIKNFEGLYKVSTNGYVYSYKFNKILSPSKKKNNNYLKFSLFKDGKVYYYTLHRLVAEAFIPNPNNYPLVLHKIAVSNGGSNSVDNLYWGTQSDNMKDKVRDGHFKNPCKGKTKSKSHFAKKVYQIDPNGNIVKLWYSMIEAGEFLNVFPQNISRACTHHNRTAGGYKWRYYSDISR